LKSIYFILAALVFSVYYLGILFGPFLQSLLVAFLLAMSTNSIQSIVSRKIKGSVLTSAIMTFLLTMLFFAPLVYLAAQAIDFLNQVDKQDIMTLIDQAQKWIAAIPKEYDFIKDQLASLITGDKVTEIVSKLGFVGKSSLGFFTNMIFILIFYFFFTLFGHRMSKFLRDTTPLKSDDMNTIIDEVSSVMGVTFYSIVFTVILEGLLFGIFIQFFGYNGFLLGILYGIASLLPVIGGAVVWIPVAILQYLHGDMTSAVIIALYTIVVISLFADTILKPLVIKFINKNVVKKPTDISELLIFFSIFAGLTTFGFWGMIMGPAIISIFISIMNLIRRYNLKDI
jgi:predicted PurR-regulated permease PerM